MYILVSYHIGAKCSHTEIPCWIRGIGYICLTLSWIRSFLFVHDIAVVLTTSLGFRAGKFCYVVGEIMK